MEEKLGSQRSSRASRSNFRVTGDPHPFPPRRLSPAHPCQRVRKYFRNVENNMLSPWRRWKGSGQLPETRRSRSGNALGENTVAAQGGVLLHSQLKGPTA